MFVIPSSYEEFCKPSYLCESDRKEIKILAEKITKNKKTPEEAVKALFEWVRDEMTWSIEKIVGAKKVLERESKKAICIDKANLFIALCRAIRIPARYLMLDAEFDFKRKDVPRWLKHVAAEIFVNGKWVIVDPSFSGKTEKLLNMSQYGKPTWVNAKNIKRSNSLSRMFVTMGNLFMPILPLFKKLKKAIEETSTV